MTDSTLALVKATPRGDATLASASWTCCCVTLTVHLLGASVPNASEPGSIVVLTRFLHANRSPLRLKTLCDTDATHRAVPLKRLPHADIIRPLGRRCGCALLLGGLVIQLDHHAIRVIDEDLPEIAARNLSRVELHPFGLQPLLHAGKAMAGEGDVMDDAGIRLLRLVGPGNIDQMHHGLALAVHPRAGEGKVRPSTLLQAQNILVEPDRVGELAGPDIEMIEHAYAHAHAMSLPFSWKPFEGPILAQNLAWPPNAGVALHGTGFIVRLPPLQR